MNTKKQRMIEWFSKDGQDGVHICNQIFEFMLTKDEDVNDIVAVDWRDSQHYIWTSDSVYRFRLGFADSVDMIHSLRNPTGGSSVFRDKGFDG